MASLGTVLKEEISRLSRREARKQIEPLRKASTSYRHQIAELKRLVALLQRQISTLGRVSKKVQANVPDADTPTRFVAKGLRTLRSRLGLSADDFGLLAGVSGQSIYNWTAGSSVPSKANVVALKGLRSLGKREALARVLEIKANAPNGRRGKGRVLRARGSSRMK